MHFNSKFIFEMFARCVLAGFVYYSFRKSYHSILRYKYRIKPQFEHCFIFSYCFHMFKHNSNISFDFESSWYREVKFWGQFRVAILRFVYITPFKNILPALANEFIVLLKETSVAGYVTIRDLTMGGNIIRAATYSAFMPLIAVALIYLVMVIFFTKLVSILERRLRKSER